MWCSKVLCASIAVLCVPAFASSEDDLSTEVQRYNVPESKLGTHTLSEVIVALEELAAQPRAHCEAITSVSNSNRVATTFDAAGNPCKIVDYSFPTAKNLIRTVRAGSIPIQNFSSADYLGWVRGETAAVADKMAAFAPTEETFQQSWYGQLNFKDGQKSLRRSFRLSDVDFGDALEFSPEEASGIQKLLKLAGDAGVFAPEAFSSAQNLLSHITLDWNAENRVFDILLDLNIFPLQGPVPLVDYTLQYKYAAEKLVRSAVLNALNYLTKFIADPVAKNVVNVALTDAFEFMDLAYEYQLNRLENTLETSLKNGVAQPAIEKGLNIVYAERSPLLMQYALSRILHTKFDLNALDKLGKNLRYEGAKARTNLAARLHSDLVLKKQCETQIVDSYFAQCTKADGKKYLYSLLSEEKVLIFNLGAPLAHDYQMPSWVMLQRNAAWAVSAALRVFPLPLPSLISGQLVNIVKSYAQAGVLDEAFLLNRMTEQPQTDTSILPWLFRQNLSPFLAKSADAEARIINANKAQ